MNPNQSNVSNIADKQQQQAPAARFTISASIDGFPVAVEIEGAKASDLRALVDRLKQIGAEPPKISPAILSPETKPADDAPPTCEFHGAMKRSNHNGWFCPKKMGDGSYCKSKA